LKQVFANNPALVAYTSTANIRVPRQREIHNVICRHAPASQMAGLFKPWFCRYENEKSHYCIADMMLEAITKSPFQGMLDFSAFPPDLFMLSSVFAGA
jgi:hypothetical protein